MLGLPTDLGANEVVSKAKEAGLTMSAAHVHAIRSQAKRRRAKTGQAKRPGPRSSAIKTRKAAKPSSKGKSKPVRGVKDAFIRAQPASMSPAQIVEEGKKAGLIFTAKYAYKTRRPAKRATPDAVAKTPTVTSKARGRKTSRKARRSTKAEFVRTMPATMPAKEVVAQAASRGIYLSNANVSLIRGKGRTGARITHGETEARRRRPRRDRSLGINHSRDDLREARPRPRAAASDGSAGSRRRQAGSAARICSIGPPEGQSLAPCTDRHRFADKARCPDAGGTARNE